MGMLESNLLTDIAQTEAVVYRIQDKVTCIKDRTVRRLVLSFFKYNSKLTVVL